LTWEYSRIDSHVEVVVCIGITALLSMTVFQMIIADKVPESSLGFPLLGTTIIVIIYKKNCKQFDIKPKK